jgi:hypothetical protein
MSVRQKIVCALVVGILAGIASAERATTLLDGVESALQSAAADLADDDTKEGRKLLRTTTKSLAKIDRETTSELGDLKLLKKIAGAVLKRFAEDPVVTQAVVDAADAADASIDADLGVTRGRVPAAGKATAAKVIRAIDKAQALLDKSRRRRRRSRGSRCSSRRAKPLTRPRDLRTRWPARAAESSTRRRPRSSSPRTKAGHSCSPRSTWPPGPFA